MSKISQRFEVLKGQCKTALIPFVTAGDPQPSITVPLMHAMVAAGADLIELGVPFSDPVADGPVIQRSSERALAHQVSLFDVLGMVQAFRAQDARTPVVLMGYLNPIEVMGYDRFAARAGDAGVDGVLVVDAPPEESHELAESLRARGLDLIYLLAPTSTEERITRIAAVASGFVYYVSVKGITGAGHLDVDQVAAKLMSIRRLTKLPVGVGLGIRNAESAARIAQVADAVIVGSVIVERMEALAEAPRRIPDTVYDFLRDLRTAIDATGEP